MPLTVAQKQRYARHLFLGEIGAAGQERLLRSKVGLWGRDSVAAAALDYLVAAGIGEIRLVSDGPAPTDLLPVHGRQHSWASAAQALASRLNPEVHVVPPPPSSRMAPSAVLADEGVRLIVVANPRDMRSLPGATGAETGGAEEVEVIVRARAQGTSARISVGLCPRCIEDPASANSHPVPQASLFAGAAAAAETVKLLLSLPTLLGHALTTDLDLMHFTRTALPQCDNCRSPS